jgi:hypothetical protein
MSAAPKTDEELLEEAKKDEERARRKAEDKAKREASRKEATRIRADWRREKAAVPMYEHVQFAHELLTQALRQLRIGCAIFDEEINGQPGCEETDDKEIAKAFQALAEARMCIKLAHANDIRPVLRRLRAQREKKARKAAESVQ